MLWLTWDPSQVTTPQSLGASTAGFLGFYAVLVLFTGICARRLALRVAASNFQNQLKRFSWMMEAARILVPIWFAVGLFLLGWRGVVAQWLRPALFPTVLGVVVGTLPAFLAWMGLWWSQYPADRALREQSLLNLLDANLPTHAPPNFRSYFFSNFRLQILFMGIPLLLIVFGHDIAMALARAYGLQGSTLDAVEVFAWTVSAGAVFLFAPEILRRILHTEPLGDTALRRRLDALCQRTGIRYRDILLWKTQHNMGNAAVMGFLPRLRYILLSDLLLERMPDEEIEAVFAHEMGHIVHRHMIWYAVFVVVLAMINAGPGQWTVHELSGVFGKNAETLIACVLFIGQFLLLFGFVSRKFERQADVYAARTIQLAQVSEAPTVTPGSHVGPYGAMVFASALRRVAVVNNIPIAARSWCHGSIATRMQYLQHLAGDASLTLGFDRVMRWLYAGIVAALVASAVGLAVLPG